MLEFLSRLFWQRAQWKRQYSPQPYYLFWRLSNGLKVGNNTCLALVHVISSLAIDSQSPLLCLKWEKKQWQEKQAMSHFACVHVGLKLQLREQLSRYKCK